MTDIPADKPLVGSDSYQGDSTNTEKLLTEKPREWWALLEHGNGSHEFGRINEFEFNIPGGFKVIERSAYNAIVRERDEYEYKLGALLCHATGGLWSKPSYSLEDMKRQVDDHIECKLEEEAEERDQLRAKVEWLKWVACNLTVYFLVMCYVEYLERERDRLRAALEFYAKGYHIEYVTTKDGIKAKANTDNGEIARAALKGEGE